MISGGRLFGDRFPQFLQIVEESSEIDEANPKSMSFAVRSLESFGLKNNRIFCSFMSL